MNPGVWRLPAIPQDTRAPHPQTIERTMLRVRCLAVTCAREVSRSSCAARGGVARSATACHTSRAFSDSSRVAPPQPPPSTAVSEHDDRIHERAVGAGGAMQYIQQQEGEVEEVGSAWQRQSRVVSYSRSSSLVLRLAF